MPDARRCLAIKYSADVLANFRIVEQACVPMQFSGGLMISVGSIFSILDFRVPGVTHVTLALGFHVLRVLTYARLCHTGTLSSSPP